MSDKLAEAEAKKAEGNKAFAEKDYEKAIGFYSEAIALDPSNHVYYSNRSICRAESGHLNDAKSDGEKCVALEPSFVKGYHRKANAEFLLGELEAAEATIRAGLKKDPNMTELKRLLQKVKGKKAATVAAARRSVAGGNNDKELQQELQEANEAYQATIGEMQEVKAKLEATAREMRRTGLTKDEVGGLQPDVPLYRSVGKMFLRSEKSQIDAFLDEQVAGELKKKSDLESRQTYLTRRLTSQETTLKDLIATFQDQGKSAAPGAAPTEGA